MCILSHNLSLYLYPKQRKLTKREIYEFSLHISILHLGYTDSNTSVLSVSKAPFISFYVNLLNLLPVFLKLFLQQKNKFIFNRLYTKI